MAHHHPLPAGATRADAPPPAGTASPGDASPGDASPGDAAGPAAAPGRRRRPGPLTVVAGVVAALFIVLGIGTPLVGIGTFSGVDLLRSFEPWRSDAPTGVRPHLPLASDTVDTVLPARELFRDEVDGGNLPSWNPYGSGGSAFGSGTGTAFYSPLAVPYLVLPGRVAPAFAKLLEMLVTIGGMALFLRRVGLGRPAALLGGILFTSSGFMVTWTNWPQAQVAALIPALFWATERFAQLRTVRAAVPIAAVVASMLLAGFPAVVGYALYAAAPYLLMRLAQLTGWSPRRLLGGVVTAGAALALGIGAVAIVLVPFLVQLRDLDYLADRAQTPQEHLPPLMLATTAVWRAFGSAAGTDGYWGPINQIEGLGFLGAGALVLVGFALLRRLAPGVAPGVRTYFVVATGVTVALGYGIGPLLGLAQHLPVFSDNPVYRIRAVLGFFLAVLAAIGFDALVRHDRAAARSRARVAAEVAGWVLAALAAAEVARRVLAVAADAHQEPYVTRQLLWAALPAGLVLAAGLVATRLAGRRESRPGRARLVVLAAIPVIVATESLSLLIPFWPRSASADYYPVTGAHQFLADNLGHDRYAAKGLTFFSGTNVHYELRNATGHSFTTREWKELLLTADPGSFPTPTFSRFGGGTNGVTVASPLLDLMAVRYFAFAPSDPVLGIRTEVAAPALSGQLRPGVPVVVPLGAGAVRGVGVDVTALARPADPFARLDVALVDGAGRTVATSSRRLYAQVSGRLVVPVAGEDVPGAVSARLTLRSDAPLAVGPRASVVRPDPADGLRLAYAEGAVIYRRGTALPRFRWADHEQVIADRQQRLTVLANIREPGRVVLSGPAPVHAEGKPATVAVEADGTDASRVRVTAAGTGYLVVADALQRGWEATVDGRAVPLVPADHAMVAVPVPAGEHVVTVRYVPPGRRPGVVISLLSVVVLAGAVAGPAVARRTPRRRPSGPPAGDG